MAGDARGRLGRLGLAADLALDERTPTSTVMLSEAPLARSRSTATGAQAGGDPSTGSG